MSIITWERKLPFLDKEMKRTRKCRRLAHLCEVPQQAPSMIQWFYAFIYKWRSSSFAPVSMCLSHPKEPSNCQFLIAIALYLQGILWVDWQDKNKRALLSFLNIPLKMKTSNVDRVILCWQPAVSWNLGFMEAFAGERVFLGLPGRFML